ncbi:MAG TPA: tetratricopeptide repeat protein [bacterium (Candidatus Stahlbacteria)]|nr:tetratricopeptide repeat protein [Candidatus Stahlbacteria bacterium]
MAHRLLVSPRLRSVLAKYLFPLLIVSCAYINTFYNAKKYYREGLKIKKEEGRNTPESALLFEKSIEKSAKVIKNYPGSSYVDDAIYLMGRCYYEKGDYRRAIKKFEELRILFPDSRLNVDATYFKAMAYLTDGSYLLAIKNFEAVARKWKRAASFNIGIAYKRKGLYRKAIAQFKQYLKDYPKADDLSRVYLNLGECYVEIRELDSMVKYFHNFLTAARTAEKTDSIKIEIARKIGEKGEYEEGIRFIGDTDKDSLLLVKADLLMKGERFEEAEDILNSIVRSDTLTTVGDAYYRLALINEEKDSFQKALEFYDSALVRVSNQSYRIDADRRRTTLSKALELKSNPGEEPARAQFLLAEIYFLNLDNPRLAINTYYSVVDSFPDSGYAPKALYAIAWIQQNILDDPTRSEATLDSLIKRYPESIFARQVVDDRRSSEQ